MRSHEFDVVLLTEARFDKPLNPDWYAQQVLQEDGLVQAALEKKGLKVTRQNWSNPEFDWASCAFALFRATWDYFHRFEEFSKWVKATQTVLTFINPPELLWWNMDKHYLRDLQQQGVNTTPTLYIEIGDTRTLSQILAQSGWMKTVLKPAVSGGGRHTYEVTPATTEQHEQTFRKLIGMESMLLQPFQNSVYEHGEVAYIILGGKFSHAVLKKAKVGDFRVQDDYGGTVHNYTPTEDEINFAERVAASCKPLPLYARVDVLIDNEGKLSVCELELIEPELWFRFHPPSADQLAELVSREVLQVNSR